eukprot:scaffold56167_cov63-Phaeocystis_antarctica.AAC.7
MGWATGQQTEARRRARHTGKAAAASPPVTPEREPATAARRRGCFPLHGTPPARLRAPSPATAGLACLARNSRTRRFFPRLTARPPASHDPPARDVLERSVDGTRSHRAAEGTAASAGQRTTCGSSRPAQLIRM